MSLQSTHTMRTIQNRSTAIRKLFIAFETVSYPTPDIGSARWRMNRQLIEAIFLVGRVR